MLSELRIALAEEVRTERLLVVDKVGRERVIVRSTETETDLRVLAPGDADTWASLTTTTGEMHDGAGRPVSHAYVSVYGGGEPGLTMEAGETVDARLDVYRAVDLRHGRSSLHAWTLDGEGLKAAPMRLYAEQQRPR